MKRILIQIACGLLAAALGASAEDAPAAAGGGLRDTLAEFLHGAEVRTPGSAGNLAMEARIEALWQASGFTNGAMRFTVPSFLPGKAAITVSGESLPIYPLHPTLARPGNFPAQDFQTRLVYLGHGTIDDLATLDGVDLNGTIGLMEYDCADQWMHFLRFGVKGFIFIGTTDYRHSESLGKIYATEGASPRYFVNVAEGARLRELARQNRTGVAARIRAEPSRWENREVKDLWVLIPGQDPELQKEVVVVVAPLDSNAVVPDLATGAQAGANLFLLTRLIETFKAQPPARTLLLVAVNAHTQNYLGERLLAWNLLAPLSDVEAIRNALAQDERVENLILKKYEPLVLDDAHVKQDEDYLKEMRSMTDGSSGKIITIKESLVSRTKRDVNLLKTEQLELLRQGLPEAQTRDRRDALIKQRAKYTHVLILFNKFGVQSRWGELTPEEKDILRGYVKEVREDNRRWAAMNRRDMEESSANSELIRAALSGKTVTFVLSLDYDWGTPQFGFSSLNTWGNDRWIGRFGGNVMAVSRTLPAEARARGEGLLLDTMSNQGGLPEGHYFNGECTGIYAFHAAGGTPAFSLRNAFSDFGFAFSPADTLDHLPLENVAGILDYFPALLRGMLANRTLTMQTELSPVPVKYGTFDRSWTVRLKTLHFDEYSANVMPTIPVPTSLVVLMHAPTFQLPLNGPDVVNVYIGLTDDRAATIFYGMIKTPPLSSTAFHFDPTFTHVDETIDAGEMHSRITSDVLKTTERTLALFPCRYEFPLLARYDSSLVGSAQILATSYLLLEARNNAAPRKFGMIGISSELSSKAFPAIVAGPAAFYTDASDPVEFLTSTKRLALNASAQDYQGAGYSTPDEMGPDFFALAAHDMSFLNQYRLTRLRGVSDELAMDFLHKGAQALKKMQQAEAANRHLAYLQSLYDSLGNQVKAYLQQSTITNDMLKAVIFYMALMLPFCFFLQKLLFKFVRVEAQMASFVVLFLATYALFRTIHPAFRIAQAPEAMFVAFVMGALGAFVIKILHGRFEGEMRLLFNTYLGMDSVDIGYSTVSQQAMMIGVNNMKRRRVRTALTTGTIVLVTFTMLAFSSVSKKMSPTVVMIDKVAPYTGLMFHWPAAPMDEASLRVVQTIFKGRGETLVRRWLMAPRQRDAAYPFRLENAGNGQSVRVEAVLGLSTAEDGFLGRMPVLPGGRFFTRDDADEVVLMASMAGALGISPQNLSGAKVRFQGHDLAVVGILDDERFRDLKDLNGVTILPIKGLLSQGGMGTAADQAAVTQDENTMASAIFSDSATVLVMPEETARRFDAKPFSISLRLKSDAPVWPVVDTLLTTTAAKFYIGSKVAFASSTESKRKTDAGSYYIGSSYRTSIGGLSILIIPLLIASTIILNTMMGSVFERKNEIAIYNAVGLNPTHIGTFFLAEAFVYSVIGSIGGYLIGQILSIMLSHFGLVKGINLNFSSLSVVYVILLTIAVVMLSTLYPAIVATKAAVPSGKRKWSMPDNDGHHMDIAFPFICRPQMVTGMMTYLDEYFARFTEASIGDLIAQPTGREKTKDEEGRDMYLLRYHVALSPFDLGVTQDITFRAAFDERVDAYRIYLELERVSGQDTNWVTTNRPFLEKMRQYLMHWRNFTSAQHALYATRGDQAFAVAPA